MTVVYCDICGAKMSDDAYRLKLWKGENIYGFNDVCPACAGSIKALIENYRKKAKP